MVMRGVLACAHVERESVFNTTAGGLLEEINSEFYNYLLK